ncbi:MAG: hypothetical protein K2G44_04905 [Clostridia bacterium]|nr:hypothetical protein [Clostridia bacterium]
MGILIKKLFARLLFSAYKFLDTVFTLFKVLVGIEKVEVNGEEGSLMDVFLSSNVITKAFLMVFLVSIVIAAAAVIVAIIKNIVNLKGGERKSQVSIAGRGVFALFNTLVMALVMVIGISFADGILVQVYNATVENEDVSLSVRIFDMCVESTYVYDEENQIVSWEYEYDSDGNIVSKRQVISYDYKYEPSENGDYLCQTDEDGNKRYVYVGKGGDYIRVMEGGYYRDEKQNIQKSIYDLNFDTQTVDDVFGVHKKDWLGLFEQSDAGYKSGREPIVYLDSFNIFLAYLTMVIILVALVWSMLGLVKRIYDLVILFIALPLVSATIPLDDGARFKAWRDAVVSKVVLAYGAVIAINVFILMIGPITSLSLGFGVSSAAQNIFKMFLLIGGALSISGGQLLVARLMGTSAEEGREMANAARTLMAGIGAAGGIARGAKNMVFGGQNKYGRQRQGLIPSLAKAGNYVGEKTGGQQFMGSKFGSAMRKIGRVASPQDRGLVDRPAQHVVVDNLRGKDNQSDAFEKDGTSQAAAPAGKAEGQNSALAKNATSQQLKNKSSQSQRGDTKK